MEASGFGRDAGPLNRGPGSAPFAFGTGTTTTTTTTPSPAAPPVPVQFPSARPIAPAGSTASSRFPSARPHFPGVAASPRPGVTPPAPIPSSARPAATAPGPSRFPSSLAAAVPGTSAATARHVVRHPQLQPRLAAPSVSRPMHPVISSRSRSPPSKQYVGSPADDNNGMGQRRLVNYADPLFGNGSVQPSEQMRMRPPDIGKTARSPPLDITSKFRTASSPQNYPLGQSAEPRDHVRKPNLSPSKFGIQNQPPFHNVAAASSPLLNSNRLVPGGRFRPSSGTSVSSPSVPSDVTHYDNPTPSVMPQQDMSEHMQLQRCHGLNC